MQLATGLKQSVSVNAESEKVVVHHSGVVLASVYSPKSSQANFWVPEDDTSWYVLVSARQHVTAHTSARYAEALEAVRGRVNRMVNWKEESCELYQS